MQALGLKPSRLCSMPGSGDIHPTALERAETEKEQWSSNSEPAFEVSETFCTQMNYFFLLWLWTDGSCSSIQHVVTAVD